MKSLYFNFSNIRLAPLFYSIPVSFFSLVSLPYIYFSTLRSTYAGTVNTTSLKFLNLFFIPNLHVVYFHILFFVLLLFYFTSLFIRFRIFTHVIMYAILVLWSSQYELFMSFSDNIFANGLSFILFFHASLLATLLRKHSGQNKRNETFQPYLWVLPVTLVSAGLSKMLSAGLDWPSEVNIQQIFLYRYLLTDNPLALTVAESKIFCSFIGASVLLFEMFGGLFLVFKKPRIYGFFAAMFITSTLVLMGIYEFLPLYLPALFVYFFNPRYNEGYVEN